MDPNNKNAQKHDQNPGQTAKALRTAADDQELAAHKKQVKDAVRPNNDVRAGLLAALPLLIGKLREIIQSGAPTEVVVDALNRFESTEGPQFIDDVVANTPSA